jgi:hypothetical protein
MVREEGLCNMGHEVETVVKMFMHMLETCMGEEGRVITISNSLLERDMCQELVKKSAQEESSR